MMKKVFYGLMVFGCIGNTVDGMDDKNSFYIDIKSKYSIDTLSFFLQDKYVHKELTNLISALKEVEKEYLAYEEMVVNDRIKEIADKIAILPKNEFFISKMQLIIQELISYCNSQDALHSGFIEKSPDFCFCLGICGYFLSDQKANAVGSFFKKITGVDMSKQNGLSLLKQSTSENAFWFLQSIGEK